MFYPQRYENETNKTHMLLNKYLEKLNDGLMTLGYCALVELKWNENLYCVNGFIEWDNLNL